MDAVDGGARNKADEEGDGSEGPAHAIVWQTIPPTKAIIIWAHIMNSLIIELVRGKRSIIKSSLLSIWTDF